MFRFTTEYKDGKLFFTHIYEQPDEDKLPTYEDQVSIFIVPQHLSIHFCSKNKNILSAFSNGMKEMTTIADKTPEVYFKEYAGKYQKLVD